MNANEREGKPTIVIPEPSPASPAMTRGAVMDDRALRSEEIRNLLFALPKKQIPGSAREKRGQPRNDE